MKTIPLTRGLVATVDDQDYPLVSAFKWYAQPKRRTFYAIRSDYSSGKKKTIRMHRMILGVNDAVLVDHKDGNGLQNTRDNMRVTSDVGNCQNRRVFGASGFKGVRLQKHNSGWSAFTARIQVKGKNKHLGCFSTAEEAARAYDNAAIESFGEFAVTNF